jgi:hypothetical protein
MPKTLEVMLERPTFYHSCHMILVREALLLSFTVEDSYGDGIGTITSDQTIACDIVLTNEEANIKFFLLERPGDYGFKRMKIFKSSNRRGISYQ